MVRRYDGTGGGGAGEEGRGEEGKEEVTVARYTYK